MKLFIRFLSFYVFISSVSFAQKENNVWAYGGGIGIDFNTPSPSIIKTAMNSTEGCASICDKTGQLLFYSNGLKVWDKTNNIMPNGNGILGHQLLSSTQGVVIAKVPDTSSLYLLFTVDEIPDKVTRTGLLRYSVIDMSLNGGKGDVVADRKNITIDSGRMSEKMLIAPGCNSLWLVTHHVDSPVFYSYKIYPTGLIGGPVVTQTSGYSGYNMYSYGEIKLSPDHKRIAMGNWASVRPSAIPVTNIDIIDFDYITGKFGSLYSIGSSNGNYTSEFSPDNSKLYVSDNVFPNGGLKQFDLSLLPDVTAVKGSVVTLSSLIYHGVRLGPDSKIYLFRRGASKNVSVIHSPNLGGIACNLETDLPSLVNSNTAVNYSFGHGTRMPDSSGKMITSSMDTSMCMKAKIILSGKNRFDNPVWNDGDTGRSKSITSNGIYWQYSSNGCDIYIDTFKVQYKLIDTLPNSTIDTSICFDKEFTVQLKENEYGYRWDDGSSYNYNVFHQSATKWVYAFDQNCHAYVDTFHVNFIDFNLSIPDQVICSHQSVDLNATTPGATDYLWGNGSHRPVLTVNDAGLYTVLVSVQNCTKADTILVSNKGFEVDLGKNDTLCDGMEKLIRVNIDSAFYKWQDGSTGQNYVSKRDGKFYVEVEKEGCTTSDTLEISYQKCNVCIRIPNAFTPDNDGRNDFFKPLIQCPVGRYTMLIVNRYGQEIFKTDNPSLAWDGTFNNLVQEVGAYYYLLKVKLDYPDAPEEIYKGDINLIR